MSPKILDKNGNPKLVTPKELEENVSLYPYEKEEWELVDPNISAFALKMKFSTHAGNLDATIFALEEERKKIKKP